MGCLPRIVRSPSGDHHFGFMMRCIAILHFAPSTTPRIVDLPHERLRNRAFIEAAVGTVREKNRRRSMHFLDWLDRQISSTTHYWCLDELWWPVEYFEDALQDKAEQPAQPSSQSQAQSVGAQH